MIEHDLKRNTYYIIRHGQSEANKQGIIASNPEIATKKYGLTKLGRQQIYDTFSASNWNFSKDAMIISSDFLRTRETAQIIQNILQIETIHLDILLRERFFGELDEKNHTHYGKVWEKDRLDPNHKEWGVESPQEVLERVSKLIDKYEKEQENKQILFVGHGDPLQILYRAVQKKCPSTHMLDNLRNAEIRKLLFQEAKQ